MSSVRASADIQNEEDYQARLAAWSQSCQKREDDAIAEYVDTRVAIIVCSLESSKNVIAKLKRLDIMKEPGRKMFVLDLLTKDPVDWEKLKKNFPFE